MPENLFSPAQKAATDKYRQGYDHIQWGDPQEQYAMTNDEIEQLVEAFEARQAGHADSM